MAATCVRPEILCPAVAVNKTGRREYAVGTIFPDTGDTDKIGNTAAIITSDWDLEAYLYGGVVALRIWHGSDDEF